MNKKRFIDHQKRLLEQLKNSKFACLYLTESLNDKDPCIFLLALKNVINAQEESISSIAKRSNLTTAKIHRILTSKRSPKLISILALLNALGFQLTIQPNKHK